MGKRFSSRTATASSHLNVGNGLDLFLERQDCVTRFAWPLGGRETHVSIHQRVCESCLAALTAPGAQPHSKPTMEEDGLSLPLDAHIH